MSCGVQNGGGLAAVEAIAQAKKVIDDLIDSGAIGGVNPADLAAAVAAAVPPVVSALLPTEINNALTPLIPSIVNQAVTQAVTLATAQATTAVTNLLQPSITALQTQVTNLTTTITTLQSALALLKSGDIPFNLLKPKNGVYTSVYEISFDGEVTDFKYAITGAGVATCFPPVGGTFSAGDSLTITVAGADANSQNLVTNLYFEKT